MSAELKTKIKDEGLYFLRAIIMAFALLGIFVMALLIYNELSTATYTRTDYIADLDEIMEDWDNVLQMANSSAPVTLPPQVTRLQAIRDRAADLELPAVADDAQRELLGYMDYTIRGYVAFMAQRSDEEVKQMFEQASDHLDAWTKEIREMDE